METARTLTAMAVVATATACSDVKDVDGTGDDGHDHNHGVATTLVLNFTPEGGGDTLSFTFQDPDSVSDAELDDIVLPDAGEGAEHEAAAYTLDIEVWNELEDPAEDLTPELAELGQEHQLFFTGSAVDGPATTNDGAILAHDYADSDADGLPIGLSNTITTQDFGTGELTVTLRHLPNENREPTKLEGLADDVASGGFGSIGGDNDIQVTFDVDVE